MCRRALSLLARMIACFHDINVLAVTTPDLFFDAEHHHKSAILILSCVQEAWAGTAAHMGLGVMEGAACMAGQWEEV